MVALYERPEIRTRNARILELFRAGELARKEIAARCEVTLNVVNNVIHQARAPKKRKAARRRCTCGRRRR